MSTEDVKVMTQDDLDDLWAKLKGWFVKGLSSATDGAAVAFDGTSGKLIKPLGYTPFNNANFTKANIKSTLGISDWALAASKPSYAFSEITGTVTNAQLAGSIANNKLANSSISIAGTSVSLGGSITAATLKTNLGLGASAYVDYDTEVTQNSTKLITSGAVYNAIDNLPEPMIMKGTLGTNGTITSLPTASASNEGFTYKVITAGTYASQAAKVGDVFVSCKPVGASAYEWILIPAGDTDSDTWRNIKVNGTQLLGTAISSGAVNFKNGGNITLTGSGNDITLGVASGYAIPTTAKQGNWDTAYGWGNHANAGYALASNLGTASTHAHGDYVTGMSWDSTNNKLAWSKGGTAQTAITIGYATAAGKLNTNAGSATNPVYFANGVPIACTYSLNKTVPADAVFTDTNTHRPIQLNGTEILGNNTTALNLKAGTGVSLTNSSGTVTFDNSGVRAATINGNYLRINTNGTNADLTIPYATSAGTASKVGSSTVGSSSVPIYLNSGTATAVSSIDHSYVSFTGRSLSGSTSVLDKCFEDRLRANSLASFASSTITIERSSDGGNTWTAVDYSAANKLKLFRTESDIRVVASGNATTANQLRITLNAERGVDYINFTHLLIQISTEGATMRCEVSAAPFSAPTTFSVIRDAAVSGWTGWNSLNASVTAGGFSGDTRDYSKYIRFRFYIKGVSSSYSNNFHIFSIRGLGGWDALNKNYLSYWGRIYNYDENLNAAFSGRVSATSFTENGTALSSKYLGINANAVSATKATQDNDGTAFKGNYLRKVTVANNTTNDFNTFESMTMTGRGYPTTGASLVHAPWSGGGPAGGYGTLTYIWGGYGIQMAWGYSNNHIYIRNKYYSGSTAVWSDSWSTVALTSDNVASATKLQTARTIWGQSFNGSANVTGAMTDVTTINGVVSFTNKGSANPVLNIDTVSTTTDYISMYVTATHRPLVLQMNAGNVGIGVAQPTTKLDVAGGIKGTSVYSASDYSRAFLVCHPTDTPFNVCGAITYQRSTIPSDCATPTNHGNGVYITASATSDYSNIVLTALSGIYLDGTVRINGNTAWHAGNDGSGSGLDADYLDGQQGSYYAVKAASKGSTTKPIYTDANGAFQECNTYAGGTAVTLNGSSKAASTASFYAPTGAGTSGQILKSTAGTPEWINQSAITAGKATILETTRTLWGQNFNGSANVTGDMSSVGNIAFSASGKNIGGTMYFDTTNHRVGVNDSTPSCAFDVTGDIQASGGVAAGGILNLAYNGAGTQGTLTQIQINGRALTDSSGIINIPLANTTSTGDGAMSHTDKLKLDGIATGATNVTTDTVAGWGYVKDATGIANALGYIAARENKKSRLVTGTEYRFQSGDNDCINIWIVSEANVDLYVPYDWDYQTPLRLIIANTYSGTVTVNYKATSGTQKIYSQNATISLSTGRAALVEMIQFYNASVGGEVTFVTSTSYLQRSIT